MHLNDVVVTLVDNTKKPLREHEPKKTDEGRRCKVFIPFESEYQFLIKNNSDTRIKLDIHIDGSLVSGNGLIVNAYATDYLDRFLDVAEKFKYVRKGHSDVADPTNPENGIIKVRVVKEKKSVPYTIVKTVEEHHHHHHDYWPTYPYPYTRWNGGDLWLGGNGPNSVGSYGSSEGRNLSLRDMKLSSSNASYNCEASSGITSKGIDSVNCFFSTQGGSEPVAEAGATIGGSKSDQTFITSTWNGDEGVATYFTFHTLGVASAAEEAERAERELLKKLKEKYENK
jgi:hypothetical protein